ncbi:hypothetical protein K3495_g8040 [Podosphaera aphanis]|nr:hypothetical protein K3495_g8040 [Podosphaera aphanis]
MRRKRPPELALLRWAYHRLIAARTDHGDFADYHPWTDWKGSGAGASAGKAQPDTAEDVKKFKQALQDDNFSPRAYKKLLQEAVTIIESLLRLKVNPLSSPKTSQVEQNPMITKILQEVRSIKASITLTQGLPKGHGQSWAKVANQSEATGTVLTIQNDEEKREIVKLSSEELVKKIGIKEVIGA